MKVIVCENYEDMSRRTAEIIAKQVKQKPTSILGLATGSTPVRTYELLAEEYRAGKLDFSLVTSFNLDEYYPISPENDQSYRYFMQKNFFNHINIRPDATFVPKGNAENPEEECAAYDAMIDEAGGIDLQLLGIGRNGHIAFNEPEEALYAGTHVTALTESTVKANSRFFASADDVPRHALTMGVGSIMKAKKILILASGAEKKEAVSALLSGRVTTACPATMLNLHPDVILLCDSAAYNG